MEAAIRYECQRCGNCCRWPGEVHISGGEAEAIAGFLGMPVERFIAEHTRLSATRRGLALLEKADGACAFLEGIDCRLQPVKPEQCRGFPNRWRFPGWREVCEALPVGPDGVGGAAEPGTGS